MKKENEIIYFGTELPSNQYGIPEIPNWLFILSILILTSLFGYIFYGLVCFIKLHESL